jgi:hypothetical protein
MRSVEGQREGVDQERHGGLVWPCADCARPICGVSWIVSTKARYLVCPPDYYEVDYVTSPWMEGNMHKASSSAAA